MNELTADNLHLWRGELHVLRGVGFGIGGGQCLQVTGSNGAGKTTLLRALCRLVPLEEGVIRWRGQDVSRNPQSLHEDLTYLGHDNGLKADLTAYENLHYAAGLRRRSTPAEIRSALARTGVAELERQVLRRMSAGQRRRVALARVLLTGGPLWILDEPGSNLDAAGQGLLSELLQSHLSSGGTAVVATHQPLDLAPEQWQGLVLQ